MELKAYKGDIYVPMYGSIADAKVYLKSEADKVIAELEGRIADGDRDFELANHQNERLLKVIHHQKYKRCLAMAEWCDAEADVADADGDYEDMRWYQKWHERWLELAEKFNPNNSTVR